MIKWCLISKSNFNVSNTATAKIQFVQILSALLCQAILLIYEQWETFLSAKTPYMCQAGIFSEVILHPLCSAMKQHSASSFIITHENLGVLNLYFH